MFKFNISLTICLYLIVPSASAALFTPHETDFSVQLLGTIFGQNMGLSEFGETLNPVITQIIAAFNTVVLTIGTIMVSYIGMISMVNTAKEGTVMGKKWSSIWIPLRSAVGMLLLVPAPKTGFSIMQMGVIWLITQGIGAANQIWNIVLDNLKQGASATSEPQIVGLPKVRSNAQILALDVLKAQVCMESLRIQGEKNDASEFAQKFKHQSGPYFKDGQYIFGIESSQKKSIQEACGKFNISSVVDTEEYRKSISDNPNYELPDSAQQQIKSVEKNILNIKIQGIKAVASDLLPLARKIAKNETLTDDDKGSIDRAARDYTIIMRVLTRDDKTQNSQQIIDNAVAEGQYHGWISAGSFYYILQQASKQYLWNSVFINPDPDMLPSCNSQECVDNPKKKDLHNLVSEGENKKVEQARIKLDKILEKINSQNGRKEFMELDVVEDFNSKGPSQALKDLWDSGSFDIENNKDTRENLFNHINRLNELRNYSNYLNYLPGAIRQNNENLLNPIFQIISSINPFLLSQQHARGEVQQLEAEINNSNYIEKYQELLTLAIQFEMQLKPDYSTANAAHKAALENLKQNPQINETEQTEVAQALLRTHQFYVAEKSVRAGQLNIALPGGKKNLSQFEPLFEQIRNSIKEFDALLEGKNVDGDDLDEDKKKNVQQLKQFVEGQGTQRNRLEQLGRKITENEVSGGTAVREARDFIFNEDSDPLLALSKYGNLLMIGAEVSWISIMLGAISLPSIIGGAATGKGGIFADVGVSVSIFALVSILFGLLWASGAGMAIYLPLIPYLMFTVTAIGWLILVVEAIIAAPVMTIGFIMPGGDELGKITPGLMLLTNIMLRPSLMVIGFIIAARLYRAVIQLINFGIASNFETIRSSESFLSPLVAIIMYCVFVIILANKCFAIIHILPDKILRWAGGQPEQTDAQAIQEAKQSMDRHAPMIGRIGESASMANLDKLQKSINNKSDSNKGGDEVS